MKTCFCDKIQTKYYLWIWKTLRKNKIAFKSNDLCILLTLILMHLCRSIILQITESFFCCFCIVYGTNLAEASFCSLSHCMLLTYYYILFWLFYITCVQHLAESCLYSFYIACDIVHCRIIILLLFLNCIWSHLTRSVFCYPYISRHLHHVKSWEYCIYTKCGL